MLQSAAALLENKDGRRPMPPVCGNRNRHRCGGPGCDQGRGRSGGDVGVSGAGSGGSHGGRRGGGDSHGSVSFWCW